MAIENKYPIIDKEKFEFADKHDLSHDKKLDTKPIGFFRDAVNRFAKNKSSVVAAYIILFLIIYAIVGPFLFDANYQKSYTTDNGLIRYKELTPRIELFEGTGFWDGSKKVDVSQFTYDIYRGMAIETGYDPIQKVVKEYTTTDLFGKESKMYVLRIDTYYACSSYNVTMTQSEYLKLQEWQDENNIQVILPLVDNTANSINANIWYKSNQKGNAIYDINGDLVPAYATTGVDEYESEMRLEGDPGTWRYAKRTKSGIGSTNYNYTVRVGAYNYFIYKYGFEPSFVFGSDSMGYDIFSRLAAAARFSLLLAVCVSAINLTIGTIYGAIEGYFGGVVDMTMERISDILANVPFTVVTVLFQLHLAHRVGVVPSLLFAFVLTGWIGMASRVRMQFYRFKNQEYVLAARTLGAKNARIMFKHIFPNTLGTIITGSILVIPGVIFSETSLTYLGIVNLNSAAMTSVGSMLSTGQEAMTYAPHVVLFPALFIALLMISFNLFGNGLRDAFNPSMRGVE